MNDVPLIKTNSINDINTSLIAIKKQLKQLNEALGLVDIPEVDTSVFVKKSDVVDVVESGNMNPVTSNAVVPVDEVTSGNMKAVTSNGVTSYVSNIIGNNTFEINQPAIPPGQRKRNNIQAQTEEIYSFNLLNTSKNGLSIDFNYANSSITIYKIVNGSSVGSKSVHLS